MANKEAEKILKDDLGVKSLRSFPKNINRKLQEQVAHFS